MSTAWSKWFDDVMIDMPNLESDLATQAIRQAAIDYCDRSNMWTVESDPETITAGKYEYDLDVDAGVDVAQVSRVFAYGDKLDPATEDELVAKYGDWKVATGNRAKRVVYDLENQLLRLVPIPQETVANTLRYKLVVRPSVDATGIADHIYKNCRLTIAKGAKARLFAMSNKPWSNPGLAASLALDFAAECASDLVQINRNHSRAPLRSSTTHGMK